METLEGDMRGAKRLIEESMNASLTRMELDMENRKLYGSGAVQSGEETHATGASALMSCAPSQQGDACIAESAPATNDHLIGHNHD